MKCRERAAVAVVLATAVLTATCRTAWAQPPSGGQEPPKTTGEKIKEKVGSAVESVKKGAASASEAVRERFAAARQWVDRMGIEARVYSRLHWDKDLNTAKIELATPRAGSIVLSGTVADEKARAKAVGLTRDTLGVVEVTDHLVVQTSTSGASPANP
jgi:hyperosmotically inducible periplasmic protein